MNIPNAKISAFKSFEDNSDYDVWLIESDDSRFVIKPVKNFELDVYSTFFTDNLLGAPRFISSIKNEDNTYLMIEYIEGKALCNCDHRSIKLALDALISIQEKYWNNSNYNNFGYTYEKTYESRLNRGKYLNDAELERAYQKYLSIYSELPRTLCHDDLLPFNVIVNENSASIIDWEFAGILPYLTSLARLIAHTEESPNAFFYMSNDDKAFAIKYYYDNFVSKHSISYQEYRKSLDLFLFYEYCEWIMLGNKYPNSNKERALQYLIKAKEHIKRSNI